MPGKLQFPFSSFVCLLQQCQENWSRYSCSLRYNDLFPGKLVAYGYYCWSANPDVWKCKHRVHFTFFFWQILAVTSLSFGHITMLWATFPFLLIIWLYTVSFIENLLFRQYATVIYALLFFHISICIHHLFGYHFFKLLNWYPPLWLLFELFNRLCCNEGTNSRFQHVFHYFLPLPVISETANIPRYASLTVDRISRLAIFGFNELC